MNISDNTVKALLDLLSQSREGTLGVLFGQDLRVEKQKTENDILTESQAKRAGSRKDSGS